MAAQIGADGLPQEDPAVLYTEQVLQEKERELRNFIQHKYSNIRSVEKDLAELTFQVKLTAGSKKAALELLRKKIEVSGERIKKAKIKEEQARKVWEGAQKTLKDEEDEKRRLCEDVTRLVQESASAQLNRLEELKSRLESLNPERLPTPTVEQLQPTVVSPVTEVTTKEAGSVAPNAKTITNGSTKPQGRAPKGKARGPLVLGKSETSSAGWNGAGFDVENMDEA